MCYSMKKRRDEGQALLRGRWSRNQIRREEESGDQA
jgi:hypothetical protein